MIDSRRLEIYYAVAREGSFTAAAEKLRLTQSAVSQQIAILERDIGVALVERVPRGIRLTTTGKFLMDRAQILLRDMSSLEREIRQLANPATKVRLGVFSTAAAHLVPRIVRTYRERYSGTRLILHASQPEDLAKELTDGLIDVGLTWDYDFLSRPGQGLFHQHLLDDPMCLLLPQDHRWADPPGSIRLTDFMNESWVVRIHKSLAYEDAFLAMCRIAGFDPNIVFRTDDYQSLQGLVAANVGVAVAPRLSITVAHPDIVVHEIETPTFMRRIGAVTLPDYRTNPLASQLLDCLMAVWGERPS